MASDHARRFIVSPHQTAPLPLQPLGHLPVLFILSVQPTLVGRRAIKHQLHSQCCRPSPVPSPGPSPVATALQNPGRLRRSTALRQEDDLGKQLKGHYVICWRLCGI